MNTYVWDARNRLVLANNNGAAFTYDALNRRIGKTILSASTNCLYDRVNAVQELNGSTVMANLLTGGIDERFTRADSSGTANYLIDALGSTVALTDPTGNLNVQYSYAPFGSMSITGSTTNSYGYTGRETDGLGINYYRARYYNPQTGRFLSEDPMGFAVGVNFYAYAGDDPMDFNDPFGWDKNPGAPPTCSGPPGSCAAPNKVVCTELQAEASRLAGFLDNTSDTSGWIAFGTGALTVLAGLGEVPTAGLDTPGTITIGAVTEFFGTVSFVTGGLAATLKSYASGNGSALWHFDASQVVNLAAEAAASRIPVVKPWAERIGDLAERITDLATKAEEGCQ